MPREHPNAGALAAYNIYAPDIAPCGGKNADGTDALIKDVEPWWAPGTKVTVIGYSANEPTSVTRDGKTYDCGVGRDATCGCRPHLAY